MKRLPVNLATHPIEQRRLVQRVRLVAGAVTLVLTVLHGLLAWSLLGAPQTELPDAEALGELRYQGSQVLEMVSDADPRIAQQLAISAGLANALIAQRTFPWSGLFTMLEETLPDDVRLEIIQPLITLDGVRVTLTAASASQRSLQQFLGALEARPELAAVYLGEQSLGPDGELRLSIEAVARVPSGPVDREVGGEGEAGERRP